MWRQHPFEMQQHQRLREMEEKIWIAKGIKPIRWRNNRSRHDRLAEAVKKTAYDAANVRWNMRMLAGREFKGKIIEQDVLNSCARRAEHKGSILEILRPTHARRAKAISVLRDSSRSC